MQRFRRQTFYILILFLSVPYFFPGIWLNITNNIKDYYALVKTVELSMKPFMKNFIKSAGENDTQFPMEVTMLKYNPNLCHESPGLQYIIYIHSATSYFGKRQRIRETWGNKYLFRDRRTAVVFLVGNDPNKDVQHELDMEYEKYGDVVQGDFKEAYRNITLKAIMGLQYISRYCSHVPYAIKSDDDVLADIFTLIHMVKEQRQPRFVMGYHWTTMPVLRTNDTRPTARKWGVSHDVFPGKVYYPPYCSGLGYVLSTQIIIEMNRLYNSTPYFWIDDVYVGLLMNKLENITYTKLQDSIEFHSHQYASAYFKPHSKPKFYFAHASLVDARKLMRKVLKYLDNDTFALLNMTTYKEMRGRKELTVKIAEQALS